MSEPRSEAERIESDPTPGWPRFAIVVVLDAPDADLAWESTASLLLDPHAEQQQVRHISRPMAAASGEHYEVAELHLLVDGFREVIDEAE